MEETVIQSERSGFFSRVLNRFSSVEIDDEEMDSGAVHPSSLRPSYSYNATVRRSVVSLDDAGAAAAGLKAGDMQILNLTETDPALRQKIVDFLYGVSYALEGNWEEIGTHIYMFAPRHAYVEMAPASPRSQAARN